MITHGIGHVIQRKCCYASVTFSYGIQNFQSCAFDKVKLATYAYDIASRLAHAWRMACHMVSIQGYRVWLVKINVMRMRRYDAPARSRLLTNGALAL